MDFLCSFSNTQFIDKAHTYHDLLHPYVYKKTAGNVSQLSTLVEVALRVYHEALCTRVYRSYNLQLCCYSKDSIFYEWITMCLLLPILSKLRMKAPIRYKANYGKFVSSTIS